MSERARKFHGARNLRASKSVQFATDIERRAREALASPDDDVAWETVRAELHARSTAQAR